MKSDETARAFAACAPGLEELVSSELAALGATGILRCAGGAEFTADPRLVMRANLHLRTASRVLLRLAHFPVFHLAQLDRRARRVDWACFLPLDTPIAVRASCKRSKIYHSGAAAERVLKAAIAGARARPAREGEAAIHISARIQANQCSLSLDTSGAPLHQRGAKQEVYAAPLRETLAAAFLLLAGFDGTEPLYDPMCGSGSLAIEGAWIAMQRAPGLLRSFAFERLAGFDRRAWAALEDAARRQEVPEAGAIFASDRAGAAVGTTRRNVQRAGLERVQVTR
ncbi:MAG: class I SAM-dependent RNA methyltransferase, partial [Deltaproteobacteria bacterium]|nr:class I SAM-dependent RNA methyltransferase [Deltaproteobacteria bacterium]